MSGINDTAYPQLRTEISDQELISVFTPSATERRFIAHACWRRLNTFHLCRPNIFQGREPTGLKLAVDASKVEKTVELKDGTTLYIFKDGKMSMESKLGRTVAMKDGRVMETKDGQQIMMKGNEVWLLDSLLNTHTRGNPRAAAPGSSVQAQESTALAAVRSGFSCLRLAFRQVRADSIPIAHHRFSGGSVQRDL